jgi:hypothetical protein
MNSIKPVLKKPILFCLAPDVKMAKTKRVANKLKDKHNGAWL